MNIIIKLKMMDINIKNILNKKIQKFRLHRRGSIDTGMGFALLIIILMTIFSAMMIGNLMPILKSNSNQPVIVISITPQAAKGNIQLYTFSGATLTPTPAANTVPQPQEKGGFNYGTPPGGSGSSAPSGGGSGGSGGGSAI